MNAAGRPALFLDRDGVINEDTGYLHKIADCRFVDGIFDLARRFFQAGFAIVIVTNQSGIGRGYYTQEDFARLMQWMGDEFAGHGVEITGVYHAAEAPSAADDAWRKPAPGMFFKAAQDLGLALAGSWVVGDKPSDIAAGRAAGIANLVLFSRGASRAERDGDQWIVRALGEVGPDGVVPR